MIELTVSSDLGFKCVHLKGRLDGMSASEVQQQLDELIQQGERKLVVDMGEIVYLSSVGLRVFINAQKQLEKVDGGLIFYQLSDNIMEIFSLSGLDNYFPIIKSEEELKALAGGAESQTECQTQKFDDLTVQYITKEAGPGKLSVIGSQDKLALAQYTESDVTQVKSCDVQFATGLAALGDNYDEYKDYFGEAMILNRSLFFYPAVKRPMVDFMLCMDEKASLQYQFLHGFGFSGDYSAIISFETTHEFINLTDLTNHLFSITEANLLGVVMLAESKGLWGMNLRQVPIVDNKPDEGKEIFDEENFSAWMNFPVEPSDINHIIAATGIAVRDREKFAPEIKTLLGKGQSCHFHGGVFEQEPLSKNVDQFESELNRVLTQMEVTKVQHLLGQTVLNSGLMGIIELG